MRRAALLFALAVLALPASADAAFPGQNGKIAYTDGNHLLLINPDGTGASEVPTPSVFREMSWSPDGSTLAGVGCCLHIAFVKPDGSGYSTIATPQTPQFVSWSPDSGKLVFGAFSLAAPFSFIYTINVDGTDPRLLASGAHLAPKWSPDGQRIVFQRHLDIYSIGVDGSDLTQLTSDAHSNVPAWSPDDTKIAFASSRTGHGEIYVMNADGSGQTQLTSTTEGVTFPDWQPIPGPKRTDYRNGAQFCKAERDFLGDAAFTQKYGGGSNAHGKCVSQSH